MGKRGHEARVLDRKTKRGAGDRVTWEASECESRREAQLSEDEAIRCPPSRQSFRSVLGFYLSTRELRHLQREWLWADR